MNRHTTRELLDASRIDAASYSLCAGTPAEAHVLIEENQGWSVFYSAGGRRLDEKTFATEHAACNHLLSLLLPHDRLAAVTVSAVTAFFQTFSPHHPVHLKVGGVWVGKPWDEYQDLDTVLVADDNLVEIILKWGSKLLFYTRSVSLSSDMLALDIVCFDLAAASLTHSRRYEEGTIRFLVANTQSARHHAEQATDRLSASVRL